MASDALTAYLRARPFERLLAAARLKVRSLGGPRGNVDLPDLRPDERTAVEGLLGHRLRPGRTILSLTEIDAALRSSVFSCGLTEALEAYFDEPLVTRADAEAQWQAWLAEIGRSLPASQPARLWFEAARDGRHPSHRLIKREYARDPTRAAALVLATLRALADLPAERRDGERLAVFANRLTGDPHAFDADHAAGRLLLSALGGGERRLVLAGAGLAADGISSTVAAVGLRVPLIASLRELRTWDPPSPVPETVHGVENPSVFEDLLDLGCRQPLVCVSGWPSAAALLLLDRLVSGGARIRYGGDFDPRGLAIALWLRRRWPENLTLWRMDVADYEAAVRRAPGRHLTSRDRHWLERQTAGVEPLIAAMLATGHVAYQEALVDILGADILAAAGLPAGRPGT